MLWHNAQFKGEFYMKTLYPLISFNKKELDEFKRCFQPTEKQYSRGDVIMRLDSFNRSVALLTKGMAQLTTTTFDGTRTIVDYYEPGSVFGRNISPISETDPYIITAKTKCTVLTADYDRSMHCCERRCEKHTELMDMVMRSVVKRAQLHVEVLGKRSIRGKLLTFFRQVAQGKGTRTFVLPLSLSDLADYISADRSAMMREMKKLNDEKIIVSHAKKITLLRDISI